MKGIYLAICITLSLIFTGCNNQIEKQVNSKVNKTIAEKTLETFQLSDMSKKNLNFTDNSGGVASANVNNIKVSINELYNENTQLYSYFLTLDENQPINIDADVIKFKTIRMNIGALPSKETGTFILNTSSPVFMETLNPNFEDNLLYLFHSDESLIGKEIRIELVLVNAEPYDGYEAETKTFRLIHGNDETKLGEPSYSWSTLTE